MARKEFPKDVVESVLIRSRRHCAVCDNWCSQKIEIHHIDSPEDNSEDNAIPVCFNCHADIMNYNEKHPKGRKYKSSELKKLRDICYEKYSQTAPILPEGQSDYGRGFHDGVIWSEKMNDLKDIWRLLSTHGDFALEILIHFEQADTFTMMDETLMDDNVKSPYFKSQYDGHYAAWSAGRAIGLWDLDGNREELFITKKGKIFRELVKVDSVLNQRFEQLKDFWSKAPYWEPIEKPSTYPEDHDHVYQPGIMNWLHFEIFKLIHIDDDRSKTYVIYRSSPNNLELLNIENGDVLTLRVDVIHDAKLDQKSGEFILFLNRKKAKA